jgi:N-acetylneuraminic acid mutarotase
VAHVLATPGQRAGASSWVERSGSLVQFGGESQGIDGAAHAENDLWRYLPSTRTWTRIAATTAPAARSFAASWLDARGEVWIFGGRRPTADGVQFYDDLWEFTPGTLTWTCRSGCAGEDASSTGLPRPEARMGATTWVDADGDLWLAGGRGAYGSSDLMDVWRFTPRTQSWTQVR